MHINNLKTLKKCLGIGAWVASAPWLRPWLEGTEPQCGSFIVVADVASQHEHNTGMREMCLDYCCQCVIPVSGNIRQDIATTVRCITLIYMLTVCRNAIICRHDTELPLSAVQSAQLSPASPPPPLPRMPPATQRHPLQQHITVCVSHNYCCMASQPPSHRSGQGFGCKPPFPRVHYDHYCSTGTEKVVFIWTKTH